MRFNVKPIIKINLMKKGLGLSRKATNKREDLEQKQWRCIYCHFDNCHLLKIC